MSDASQPWNGVPLHPERDGWHWVCWPNGGAPMCVEWGRMLDHGRPGWRAWRNSHLAHQYYYLGPCILPADLAAERAAAAEAMREACVGKLEEKRRRVVKHYGLGDEGQELRFALHDMIEAVRSLPIPSASALAEREKEAYRRGWLDRESDFMAGVERTGMVVTDESALAERDERMREEGRREAFTEAAQIAQDRESEGGEYGLAAKHIAAAIRMELQGETT